MKQVKAAVDKGVGAVLVVLMAVSVINVLWQVFTRFVLEVPSSFTEELARYLLIWIGVLGAGYAVGQRAHLALELLPEKLQGRRRQVLGIVIQACVILFAAFVMVLGGLRLVYVQLRLGQTSPSLGLPLGWVYLVLPLSGLLMIFYAAFHMREGWSAPHGAEGPLLAGETAPRDQASAHEEKSLEANDSRSQLEEEAPTSGKNSSAKSL